jgi:hypothetical protein
MSSNAPTPIPKAKRRGIPFTIRKNYRRWSLCPVLRLPALPRSQRGLPCYLALHDIHDATVIDSDAYRRNGGGHFARWQSAIADWHRHLYLTNNTLREVAPDEVLLLGDTAEDLPVAAPILLQPGGLATEQTRYAAIVPRDNLHHLATTAAVFIYQPITARLRNPAQRA